MNRRSFISFLSVIPFVGALVPKDSHGVFVWSTYRKRCPLPWRRLQAAHSHVLTTEQLDAHMKHLQRAWERDVDVMAEQFWGGRS